MLRKLHQVEYDQGPRNLLSSKYEKKVIIIIISKDFIVVLIKVKQNKNFRADLVRKIHYVVKKEKNLNIT